MSRKVLVLVCVFIVVISSACARTDARDQAIDSLNRQLVRLTKENVDLRQAVKDSASAQAAIRADLQRLTEKVAYLESHTPSTPPAASVATAPVQSPAPVPKRGGFTDWSQSSVATTASTDRQVSNTISSRPTNDPSIIAQCNTKWGTNFEMAEYCQKQQQGAKDRLECGNVYGIP